ncbi:MAG TPA: phosphonate ABC transporter ATP-binding protein [Pseudobdellovibrionaceae bacterium]|nr:phosphonate ABC transporter ATP-binding protein [Pseudobdellovibrionaceae bacterium]
MSESILSIRNLVKTYPNGVQALKGVNIDVKKGEFLVVIGLSGSGKSTLLRCINRLHSPTSGEILFNGKDVAKVAGTNDIRELRREIGMIFQHFNLIPRHTVLSNVLMGRLGETSTLKSLLGLWSPEDKAKAVEYLRLVGIAEKAKIRADQLSGGQQQRVAIARALTQDPQILLADEPVASLDPATCHTVMDYLRKVNRELGITVIANLHFLSLVREYATRVVALKAGEVVYEGSPSNINDSWFERIYGEGAKEVHIN